MKRAFTAVMALLLAASLGAASAGGGTSKDPLVSQSYVDGAYTDSVLESGGTQIAEELGRIYSDAVAELKEKRGGTEYAYSSGYTAFFLPAGGTVDLVFGSSVIVTGGSARISVTSGSVIDVSSGEEHTGAFTAEKNRRYFCAEDSSASLTASEKTLVTVNGSYYAPGAEPVMTHYSDVNTAKWFYDAAKYVYDNKLYHDWADGAFRPSEDTTRAELVYALWTACGSPSPESTATFDDLEPGWYLDAASWAAENDIVRGYSGNKYMPYNSITRQEIAVIMYRYAKYMGYSTSGEADLNRYVEMGEIADWALTEMRWANAEGLITGTTNVNLAPLKTAWRSEVATIIMRYLESR